MIIKDLKEKLNELDDNMDIKGFIYDGSSSDDVLDIYAIGVFEGDKHASIMLGSE